MQNKSFNAQLWGQVIFNITGRLPNKDSDMPVPALPLPFGTAKFAFNAQYVKALGTNALPREWYVVPGSYHLDWWPVKCESDAITQAEACESAFSDLKGMPEPNQVLEELYTAAHAKPSRCAYETQGTNRVCGYAQLTPEMEGLRSSPQDVSDSTPHSENSCSVTRTYTTSSALILNDYNVGSFGQVEQLAVREALAIQSSTHTAAVTLSRIKSYSRGLTAEPVSAVEFYAEIRTQSYSYAERARLTLNALVDDSRALTRQLRRQMGANGANPTNMMSTTVLEYAKTQMTTTPTGDTGISLLEVTEVRHFSDAQFVVAVAVACMALVGHGVVVVAARQFKSKKEKGILEAPLTGTSAYQSI
jgi:hypothetical protein